MKYFRMAISGDDMGIPLPNVIEKTIQGLMSPDYEVKVDALFTRSRIEKDTGTVFNIEGPWGTRTADGLVVPIFLFREDGERVNVGQAVGKVDDSMTFELELDDAHKDVERAYFELPMRFVISPDKDQS